MEVDLRRQSLAIPIKELHDVGDARRQVMNAAKALGFNETLHGRAGIIATELGGNLVKHAGGGTLVVRVIGADDAPGLEIMSIDDGPGMDVYKCLEDGYSTAGSPGTGLGAVKRLAGSLDIYSYTGKGSVIVSELWQGARPQSSYDVGAVCLPVAGEHTCGDSWAVKAWPSGLDIVVSDGLGHGPIAAEASYAVLDIFHRRGELPPGPMLDAMHAGAKGTRGAAVLACRLDASANALSCAGIGNIGGYVMAFPKPRGIVSMNGIVGHQIHKVKEFSYDCGGDDLIILHSDGLTTSWKLDDFPGLTSRSAAVIAGVMYKAFKRGRDDATVVVVRRR